MGKGCGSVCGKPTKQQQQATATPAKVESTAAVVKAQPVEATPQAVEKVATTDKMVKIYIVYYSLYGHVHKLAQAIKEGVDSIEGAEGVLYQVPETLPAEVLEKMHAPPKPDVPVITAKDLPDADGFIFGFPTRFGTFPAQFKAFLDSTGQLWQSGALVGKPCGLFTSTATQNGGQETTLLTAITVLTHHGMIFVPVGYSFGGGMFDVDVAHGGSPYGAGTLAGADGSRQPSEVELAMAKHQGSYFSKVAAKLKA
jgi:NAD(P)H dehydrogenase (quinone)